MIGWSSCRDTGKLRYCAFLWVELPILSCLKHDCCLAGLSLRQPARGRLVQCMNLKFHFEECKEFVSKWTSAMDADVLNIMAFVNQWQPMVIQGLNEPVFFSLAKLAIGFFFYK